MSGNRVLFLHVGAPKTGTSFLQSALWASKQQLREQGLTLPMDKVEDHVHAAQDVRELYDERRRSPKVRGGLDRFAAALAEVDTPRALFSMEVVVAASPRQIDRFFAALGDFDVHIVITARDLARQIPSTWQQSLKRRSGTSYSEFLSEVLDKPQQSHLVWRSQDIAEIARRWGKSLSPDRVHIVTVPPRGQPTSLLLDRFCSVIGVDPALVDTASARSNTSLNAPQAELLRRVNAALGNRLKDRKAGYNRMAKRYFAMQVLGKQTGPPLKLPTRYAARTNELSERMIAEIRERGYDVVGDLADLEPKAFGDVEEPEPAGELDDSDGHVLEVAVQALAAMLEQRNQDVELIAELRQRARRPPKPESWRHRQRRRVAAVGKQPSLLIRGRRSSAGS